MEFYRRLVVSLALVSGIAAGLLAATYRVTFPVIQVREREERAKALKNIFFLGSFGGEGMTPREISDGVVALHDPAAPEKPAYYAARGEAAGYNSASPIALMVGFTASGLDARDLLAGYVGADRLPAAGERGHYIVGFSVLSSEETPGLGERVKDRRPPFTWLQFVKGETPPPDPDTATSFQRQFRGRLPDNLLLKKRGGDLDAITASTITSTAVTAAIRDAGEKLAQALRAEPSTAE
ncbi:MAG: FMN-binding protein [Planctomycetota bacterium]|jgi:Na+-translocating ferredoxin:NAD+ oxidoreductase RnfG subunit|nr:FMN-binding protein [Planctomycetota bacterium]